MPSPFTWDTTKPAGGDALSIGDDQIRTDKGTLRDVLRTLVPYGTPTTGWRVIQIDNDIYIVHNAKYDGAGNWSHDDTAVNATALRITSAAGVVHLLRVANASTWATAAWLESGQIVGAASAVNYLQLLASAAGADLQIVAVGDDTDIDILLAPKGAGRVLGTEIHWGSGSEGALAADNTARTVPPSGSAPPTTTENDSQQLVPEAVNVVRIRVNLDAAPNGVGKTRTFTLRKNSANTALTVTYTNAESGAKTATGSVAIAAGDEINWLCEAAGTPDASRVQFGIAMEPA